MSLAALPPAALPPRQQQTAPALAPTVAAAPAIVQTVSVQPHVSRTDLLADTADWGWVELRDYVVSEITARFGPFPRDSRKEHAIFSRFLNAYGADGIAVAKFAFGPACDGWWGKAPISITRFCKGSDPYFVAPILARLADAESVSG